jgi:hypothetical protein
MRPTTELPIDVSRVGRRPKPDLPAGSSALTAFRLTFDTGRWILRAPFVLAVICFGMLFDGILRMVVTLASQYYRMVALPESTFGTLGSMMALAGVFIPCLALRIAEGRSPAFCLAATAGTALAVMIFRSVIDGYGQFPSSPTRRRPPARPRLRGGRPHGARRFGSP